MIDKLDRATHKLRNEIRQLHRASERDQRAEFIVEGPHACTEFLHAGVSPIVVVVSDDIGADARAAVEHCLERGVPMYVASQAELQRMGTTATSQGIIMVVPKFMERACGARVVALDGISDPGNAGTIIRTAAWFGCTDVVVSDGCVDVYNPKVVRSSAGALASLNIIHRPRVSDFLDEQPKLVAIVADAHGGVSPSGCRGAETWCLIVGSEAHGVSEVVRQRANLRVTIPGHVAAVESLNAAVAAAILLYELNGSA